MASILFRVFESSAAVVARFERDAEWDELQQATDDLLNHFERTGSERLLLNVAHIELWSGRYRQIARRAIAMQKAGKMLQLCGFDTSDQAFLDLTKLRGIAEVFDTEQEARSTWDSEGEINEVSCSRRSINPAAFKALFVPRESVDSYAVRSNKQFQIQQSHLIECRDGK